MEKVVIIDTGYDSYEFEYDLFGRNGFKLELYLGEPNNAMAKADFAKDAVGILVRGTEVGAKFLDKTPNIRALVRYGIGYDNIDIPEATRRGIKVANVRGYARHSVSDHALAMIYSLARMLPMAQQQVRSHFSKPPVPDIFELHDKT
jgi:D-3-phosphoglycerate dehydrogenase / 2-oxoglutarate reductase